MHRTSFLGTFGRLWRDDTGVASVEAAVVFPIIMSLVLMALEAGVYMTRQVLLDRGMDEAVRTVRLSTFDPPDYSELKQIICTNAGIIDDCTNSITLEMRRFDPRQDFVTPGETSCVDRVEDVEPTTTYEVGSDNEIMFLRACVKFDPIFPTSGWSMSKTDELGEFALVSMSVYVSEPGS